MMWLDRAAAERCMHASNVEKARIISTLARMTTAEMEMWHRLITRALKTRKEIARRSRCD